MKITNKTLCSALLVVGLWPACSIVAQGEFNIENPAVQEFMASSNATFSSDKGVINQAFYDRQFSYRPDQPAMQTITFHDTKATKAKVYLSTAKNMKNADLVGEFHMPNGNGSCVLRNFIPNLMYYYKVVADDGRTIKKGSIKTSGQVRMIAIDRGFNIRDLGGWKGLNGKSIRYAQIYRGGSLGGTDKDGTLSDITDEDRAELHRIGIRAQLDLRAATNKGRYAGEGSLHSYSAGKAPMADCDFNNTMTDNGAYNEDASVISDIAWIIYELKKGRPVYFNCRQGADRTGTIAFLIEGLLGCYEYTNARGANQMALDYELTGFSQANLIDNWKVSTSCRPAQEAYTNKHKLFRQLLDLQATEPDIHLANLQQKCYYYLNRYTNPKHGAQSLHIDKADLDWFIAFMLQMSTKEYAPHQPSWAQSGTGLKQVAEACANVVDYYSQK